MNVRRAHAADAAVVCWGRVAGEWGAREWDELRDCLRGADLSQGSRVVLDFSETRHMHYRTAPRLLRLAHELEERGAVLCVTGLSDYLRRIVEVACALEGRDFIETHGLVPSSQPGPADPRADATRSAWRAWRPQDLAVPSTN